MEKENLLIFKLNQSLLAFRILDIKEILRNVELKSLPSQPEFISGVMNLRGDAVAVIDLKKRFFLGDKSDDLNSRILLTNVNDVLTGLRVDEVLGLKVLEVSNDLEAHLEKFYIKSHFIDAVAFFQDQMVVVVNIDQIFNEIESELLETIVSENG